MDRLGKLVREAREKKGESVTAMARRLKISAGFARHIESAQNVPISPRIVEELGRMYRISHQALVSAAQMRSRRGKAYYRAYHANKAS